MSEHSWRSMPLLSIEPYLEPERSKLADLAVQSAPWDAAPGSWGLGPGEGWSLAEPPSGRRYPSSPSLPLFLCPPTRYLSFRIDGAAAPRRTPWELQCPGRRGALWLHVLWGQGLARRDEADGKNSVWWLAGGENMSYELGQELCWVLG